jgi:hypothetical protein
VGKVVFVPSEVSNRIFVDLDVSKERSYSLLEGDGGGCLNSRNAGLEHEDSKAALLGISRGKELS